MRAKEVLKVYEEFRVLTQEMLKGVENDAWDRIPQISERREKLLHHLMTLDDTLITDHSERKQWSDLIHQCLEMNQKMQGLIENQMKDLKQIFNNQKRLFQAYHLHSGG